jgi:RNA polymerase sigma factor (sigma-70 family)
MDVGRGDNWNLSARSAESMQRHSDDVHPGIPTELASICEECFPGVLKYTVARVGNREVAHDIVGDVFERVVRDWSTFRGQSSPRAWIFGIARHVIADHWRGRVRGPFSLTLVPDDRVPAPQITPQEHVERTDEAAALRLAVSNLCEDDQELLALHFAADLRLTDIAQLLGVRSGTVRMRLHRVTRRLRRVLEAQI